MRVHRTVGIIGGMGPAATLDLMQKVLTATRAKCDQEHVPLIVWNVPQIPPRVPAIENAQDPNIPTPLPKLLEAAHMLRVARVEAIAIACNTAHWWADPIEQAARVPLLHIADAALSAVVALGAPGATRLLATRGTVKAGFYAERAQRLGIGISTSGAAEQLTLDTVIAGIKAGDVASARARLFPLLEQARTEGVQTFVLGCTELPLAIAGSEWETVCVDATAALAQAIVHFSRGARTR